MSRSWKNLFLIAELVLLLLDTGCWSYRDVEETFIAAGAAVDLAEDGSYRLTTEMIDFAPSSGRATEIESVKVESTGETISEAVKNALKKTQKKIYWADAQVIIISDAVARKGIMPIFDWVLRDAEPRLNIYVAIAKQESAKAFFETQSIGTNIHSFEMARILDTSKHNLSEAAIFRVYEIANDIAEEGLSATMPAFHIVINGGKQKVELCGSAIFKKDKLIGYLSSEESKYLNIIRNNVESGFLTLSYPLQSGQQNISLEIGSLKTDCKPVLEDGNLHIKISTKAKVSVNNNFSGTDADLKGVMPLQNAIEKMIKDNVHAFISKIQAEYDADIFGFGNEIEEDMPQIWRQYSKDWDLLFKTLPVDIECKVEITTNGEYKKLPVGD